MKQFITDALRRTSGREDKFSMATIIVMMTTADTYVALTLCQALF